MKLTFAVISCTTAACTATGGERFQNGCPDDEVCSDETPEGLIFRGPMLGETILESHVRPVAEGGTSHIEILEPSFSFFGLPYQALSTHTRLVVAGQDANVVAIRGEASGEALLRIVDAQGALYDRLAITVSPIAEIGIIPSIFEVVPQATAFALARNSISVVNIALFDNQGERLIDDSLTAISNDGTTEIDQRAWDTLALTPAGESAALTLQAGGAPYVVDLPTVVGLDQIRLAKNPEVIRNSPSTVCFEGRFAAYTVLGINWQVSVDGALPTSLLGNCVSVEAPGAVVTLDVVGLGFAESFELTTVAAARRADKAMATKPSATPGDRARAQPNLPVM